MGVQASHFFRAGCPTRLDQHNLLGSINLMLMVTEMLRSKPRLMRAVSTDCAPAKLQRNHE